MRVTLLLCLALTGCAERVVEKVVPQPYEVKVQVPVEKRAPDTLLQRYVPTEYPEFRAPDSPGVRYGLTQQDWERLQIILRTMQTRDQAWRRWATGKGDPNE